MRPQGGTPGARGATRGRVLCPSVLCHRNSHRPDPSPGARPPRIPSTAASAPRSTAPTPRRPSDARRVLLADEKLTRLLSVPQVQARQVPRSRDIFVNRNLRMGSVELIGFDMDYTLAIYHMRRLEQLAYDMTLAKLISERGYPALIGQLQYDHHFVMRGLAVDQGERQPAEDGPLRPRGAGLARTAAAGARGVEEAVPQPPGTAEEPAVRVDRHALRPARGVPLRRHHRAAGVAGPAGGLRQAVRRHPRGHRRGAPGQLAQARGAQGPGTLHLPGSRAGRRAAQAALGGKNACSC